MKYRFAFAGFRHPHIFSLWEGVKNHPRCEIVAACESDAATRTKLAEAGSVKITHDDFGRMLAGTECDIVAIGDVYAKRGALAVHALESGRHVLSDKPVCTRMDEWERIAAISRAKKLSVGCQLDLVELPVMRRLCEIVRQGLLERICTITIFAQHPLRLESRASWYFDPGCHGGTINDIGIHVFDLVPWLTGQRWSRLFNSRQWNAKAGAFPHFKDCAQFYGMLENDISCFADVSYLAPNALGFELPHYWRITVHGTKGMAETNLSGNCVTLVLDDDKTPQNFPGIDAPPLEYLTDFLAELAGKPVTGGMTTARVLLASRLALAAQQAANSNSSGNGLEFPG